MASVLVLDDNSHIVFLLSEFLALEKHTVIRAATPSEALGKVGASKPNLAIIDYDLPEMNGFEVIKKIRREAWGSGLPVIVLTGVSPAKLPAELGRLPKVKLLAKPVDFPLLAETIKQMLG